VKSRSGFIASVRSATPQLPVREFLELFVPRDPRGIALGCGFAGLGALGLVGAINGDSLGYAYLAGALGGGFFLQTRLVPAFLWLLLAAGGVWALTAGSPAAWVQVAIGIGLATLATLPVAEAPALTLARPLSEVQPNLRPGSSFLEVSPQTAGQAGIVIRTVGRLQVLVDGQDLAPSLLDKRILGYLWCSLLAVAVSTSRGAFDRAQLASELLPGPNRRSQLERLRRQLWDLQHDLPQPLGAMVSADRNQVRLDLTGVDCDLITLRRIANQIVNRDPNVTAALIAEVQAALDATGGGRFLPEFEDLARSAHQSRASAMQAVTEARAWVLQTRISLAQFLARQSHQSTDSKES